MRKFYLLLREQSYLLLLVFLSLAFFLKFFLKGQVPIPADVIVGIYYPWRDHIWNGLIAGVPFKNGHLSDIVSIIYPWRIYGIELLKVGIAPLWIPHALSGMPLLANFQSGLLYPLNVLFWLFSDTNAWSLYIILQPILASIFCFAYLRNLSLSKLSSLFGSIIFAFSGFSLVWLEYGVVGHAGLWLPLALLSVDKLAGGKKIFWLVIGSLSIGFSVLAGYPQISLFVIGTTLFYLLWRWWQNKKTTYLWGLVFLLLGLFLAAVQIVPGAELWFLSIRQSDPTNASFGYGIMPLKNFVLTLTPDFFGNPATGNFWGKAGYNESAFYVGIVGLLFVLFSLFSTKKGDSFFFKIILLISLLFAFQNPLSSLPQSLNLPGLSAASAGRWLFLTTFSLSVLAAFGVDLFLNLKKKRLFFLLSLFILVTFGVLWCLVLGRQEDIHFQVAKRNLILPTLLFFLALILLTGGIIFKKFRGALVFLVFLVLVFDLFRFGWKYNSFSPKNYLFPETNLTNFLKESSGLYRFVGLIPQSMFIPYNLSSPEGYEPLLLKRYSEFANQINEEKFSQVSAGSRWVIVNRFDEPLLNLMGVKYILSFNPAPVGSFDHQEFKFSKDKYKLVFQYGSSQIYENLDALPRSFLVHDYLIIKDEAEILKTLKSKDFDFRKTIILEKEPQDKVVANKTKDEVSVDEKHYFQNEVLIKTKSDAAGFLFLSDNYYPGWQTFVDGQRSEIYRANYTFRAVFVPAGEHEIRFLFEPQSFKIGLRISLAALLMLLGFLIYEIIKSCCSSSKRSA